jgi:hypothetical protein
LDLKKFHPKKTKSREKEKCSEKLLPHTIIVKLKSMSKTNTGNRK